MDWWQALILGIVQGLTEFLPVSSSGHLVIFRELLGVDPDGFLDFTVMVHLGTVISTIIVFWKLILDLVKGLFKFSYNDETDYVLKLVVSMIPVAIVGFFFKDFVEGLFGESLVVVGVCLLVTAALLLLSDIATRKEWAFVVGIGQALAVAPGLSRSGTTIATGLLTGVRREKMAGFSFLMVLVPIIGEQLLSIVKSLHGTGTLFSGDVSGLSLAIGFVAALLSGLFACKAMVALVKKARLGWFSLYCAIVAIVIFILA